jgi:hypothetical protein
MHHQLMSIMTNEQQNKKENIWKFFIFKILVYIYNLISFTRQFYKRGDVDHLCAKSFN